VAQPVPLAKVDEGHMGRGLGGMLIDAAEQHSQRCLAASGPGFHGPSAAQVFVVVVVEIIESYGCIPIIEIL
jgi:hypothetical protein